MFFNNRYIIASALTLAVVLLITVLITDSKKNQTSQPNNPQKNERVWQIKSIDTMKYSRDPSMEKLNDSSFDNIIEKQVKSIKNTGANYVAIATPYDEKFLPILSRWVNAARENNLHIWFRGNFSGWEGWFGYSKNLTRDQHMEMMRNFIKNNANLFQSGDAFSPCPECENGGPGDPRQTGDVEGFRQFMVTEHVAADEEFKKINKNIRTNLASMNLDVAKVVMNKDTTKKMGNLVVIDHYTKTAEDYGKDLQDIIDQTGSQIMFGELGAPIPGVHGNFTEQEQADWLDQVLSILAQNKSVIGINYWTSFGGSTKIFDDDGTPKPAAAILKKYFNLTKYD